MWLRTSAGRLKGPTSCGGRAQRRHGQRRGDQAAGDGGLRGASPAALRGAARARAMARAQWGRAMGAADCLPRRHEGCQLREAAVQSRRMGVGACAAFHRVHMVMVAAVVLDHMPVAAAYDFGGVAAWRGGGAAGAAEGI